MMLMAMLLITGTGWLLLDDDGVPDTVVAKITTPASNTTIIEHDDAPAPDVDVNVDATPN